MKACLRLHTATTRCTLSLLLGGETAFWALLSAKFWNMHKAFI